MSRDQKADTIESRRAEFGASGEELPCVRSQSGHARAQLPASQQRTAPSRTKQGRGLALLRLFTFQTTMFIVMLIPQNWSKNHPIIVGSSNYSLQCPRSRAGPEQGWWGYKRKHGELEEQASLQAKK